MPTLELTLDASGVQRGASATEAALQRVGAAARTSEDAFLRSGQAASRAFASTGGAISATQGIASAATAFGSLNTQAAAFYSARALLDIGRTAQDFRELAGGVGSTGGAFRTLGLIIRANPLLTLATVISGVALAMGFFGDKTEETNEALKEQQKITEGLRSGLTSIGTARRRDGTAGEIQAIDQLLQRFDEANVRDIRFGPADTRVSRGLGNDTRYAYESEIRRLFGLQPSDFGDVFDINRPFGALEGDNVTPTGEFRERLVGESQLRDILGRRRRDLELRQYGTEADLLRESTYHENERQEAERLRQLERERQEQAQQAMDELIQSGRELGATLGDAFFRAASGAQSVRQILADLLLQLARATSVQAFSNFGGWAASGFTQTQATQNQSPGALGWERVGG